MPPVGPPLLPPPLPPAPPRGRYAPSPTGAIHLGNARSALAAWLSVRCRGGRLVWREEDLDRQRVVPGMAAEQRADLAWLGLDWDEGPDAGGALGPYRQSERSAFYEAALATLADAGRLFPCRRSRRDLAAAATAPHGPDAEAPFPAAWRPRRLESQWFERWCRQPARDAALRFLVGRGVIGFTDRVHGRQAERLDLTVGDFVLARRDGVPAYQLAVVVDDLAMAIDEVVRGADLLASTARQIALIRALGGAPPAYAHVPLVVAAGGGKLSKRDGGSTLAALREGGAVAEQVTGFLAASLGLLARPEALRPADLLPLFAWQRVPPSPFALPADPLAAIREVR